MEVRFKGRIVIGTANYTAVSPESLLNILQAFRLNGTHETLGNVNLFNASGASLFKMNKLYKNRGNSLYINGVRISDDVISSGIPAATFGNTGTYDVEIIWNLPMAPYGLNDSQALLYYLNDNAWGQSLQVYYAFGDLTAFGTPAGGTTVAFSAFGTTGAGTPSLDITLNFAYLGPLATRVGQAVCVRNVIAINSVLQNNSGLLRLALLQSQKTTSIITKTGALLAGTSAGVNVYASLSDLILEGTILRKNNAPIRNLVFNSITKDTYGERMGTIQPTGFLGIFFDDGWPTPNAWASVEANKWLPGEQFDIASQIVGAAAANAGEVWQEYIIGDPVVAL
jgi:hypothetical protein